MATFRLVLNVPSMATNNAKLFEKTPTNTRKEEVLNDFSNLFASVASGENRSWLSGQTAPSLKLCIDQNAVAATGTVTCASVANNDTVTIGNQVLTGKSAAPSGQNQWLCAVSNNADAIALAACINAHTTLSLYVSAAAASGVVTITAIGSALGVLGNAIILASSNGTRLAVVAMASGADDATARTYSF